MTQIGTSHNLGRYRPIRILGEGAAGIVYLAEDRVRGRRVTIKVILSAGLHPATRTDALRRFARDAKAAARCRHPGIVAIHDYGEEDGTPFIVMDPIEGQTLQSALDDPASRPALDPIGIALQILDALESAHRLQLTHRDLKPAHILLSPAGRVKITDFGIARVDQLMPSLPGAVAGTPGYMAPEQAAGGTADHRADLFAVGAMLYELLAGKQPFQGRSPAETLARLQGPVAAPMAMIPQNLVPILQRALAKPPETRFQTAGEFAAALRRAMASDVPEPAVLLDRSPFDMAEAFPPPEPVSSAPGGASAADYWGTEFLKQLEAILANHLGPIAGILVRNAASRTTQPAALYATLSASLPKSAQRAEFQQRVARLYPLVAGAPPAVPADAPTQREIATSVISQEALQAAQTALAHYLGPIAKVLVRQAAEQVTSAEDLCERLVVNLPKPEEAAAFRRKLMQDLNRLMPP
jgi:eukaryotic-like serine/threonine-protein kinase